MRKSDSFVDLEYGKIASEDEIKEIGCSGSHSKKKFDRKRSGVGGLNGFTKEGDSLSTSKSVLISAENAEILMGGILDEAVGIVKEKNVNEKWKKSSFKKPPKPPRPPGAPSLDEADMKLVKEISELARLKHARKERIKAMKKKRRHKGSSSTSFYATIVTILFCFIVIYQANTAVGHRRHMYVYWLTTGIGIFTLPCSGIQVYEAKIFHLQYEELKFEEECL